MNPGNGHGPNWRNVAVAFGGLLLAFGGFITGTVFTRLNEHDNRLNAQSDRVAALASRNEILGYRVSVDSAIVLEVRTDIRLINDKLDRLLRARGLVP